MLLYRGIIIIVNCGCCCMIHRTGDLAFVSHPFCGSYSLEHEEFFVSLSVKFQLERVRDLNLEESCFARRLVMFL